jgi:uncharacterized protein (TIGR02147 family)
MKHDLSFNRILVELLERKKEANPSYSLRAFARDLKLSPSFVSRALRGEKHFSANKLKLIFRVLDVDKETQTKIKSMFIIYRMGKDFKDLGTAKISKSHLEFKRLPQNKLNLLTKWHHIPVLELLTVTDFKISEDQIAHRLNITRSMAHESLEALRALKVISLEDGQLSRKNNRMRLASSSSKPEIRSYHQSMIAKAVAELNKTDDESFSLRLVTGITFGANLEKLEAAKAILNDAIHKASKILGESSATEVYQLNLQLFPLTKK